MKSWEIHNLKVDEYIKNHRSKYGYLDYLKLKKSQDEETKKFGFKNYKEYLEYEEEHWEFTIGDVL